LTFLANDRGNSRDIEIIDRLGSEKGIEIPGDKMARILDKIVKEGFCDYEDEQIERPAVIQAIKKRLNPLIERTFCISLANIVRWYIRLA
jgi:hypothetical protein